MYKWGIWVVPKRDAPQMLSEITIRAGDKGRREIGGRYCVGQALEEARIEDDLPPVIWQKLAIRAQDVSVKRLHP